MKQVILITAASSGMGKETTLKLIEEGHIVFGARPLKRIMQKELVNEISTKILEGDFQQGDSFELDYCDDRLLLNKVSNKESV